MTSGRGAGPGRVSARTVQIGLGILWLLDGLLQLQPKMFGVDFANQVILPTAQGQPGPVSSAITHMAHLIAVQPALANVVFASVQILIGVGLLIRQTVRPALALSFAWALGVWALGEGFGMLFTGMASPLTGAPGGALLYAAIGLLVWPRTEPPAAVRRRPARPPPRGRWGHPAASRVGHRLVRHGIPLAVARQPGRGDHRRAPSARAATGEPGWLAHVQLSVAHAVGGGGGSVAVACAVASFVIGAGPAAVAAHDRLLGGRHRARPRLLAVRGGVRPAVQRHCDRSQQRSAPCPAGAGPLPEPCAGPPGRRPHHDDGRG